MKRFLFLAILLSSVFAFAEFSAFAELYPARRYVELGVSGEVFAAQNAMQFTEIFKKQLVLDLKKIRSQMSNSGISATAGSQEDVHLDFNFKKFGIGLHAGTEMTASAGISNSLFDVLDGIAPGTVYSGEANIWAEAFATVSIPVRFNVNKWKVTIRPTYFIPFFYLPNTTISGYAVNGADGSVTAKASAPIEFYTISEFKGLIDNGDFSTDFVNHIDSSSIMSDAVNSAGLDIGAAVEYPVLESLDIGAYAQIPLVPGRMRHKVSAVATISVHSDSLLSMFIDDEDAEASANISDASYSRANYIVNRPFRLGAECAWRPVGKWLTLRGMLGLALRNPFGQDVSIKSFYPEYKLGAEIVGIGMFGLGLSTSYAKKVFAHGLDIMLNFRAVEFDFSAAVCSSTFVQSFRGEGFAAGFGVKLGW